MSYVVVGAFARVVHGTGEVTRGLDIAPSPREDNVRALAQALEELGAAGSRARVDAPAVGDPITVETPAGS